jgi:hypothetical protein
MAMTARGTVMPAIRAWMTAHQEPANASQIARGAGVHRSSVRTFLDYLDPGELELTGLPGSPKYRLRHPDSFERMLAAEAVTEAARMPLDEALAGIHRIAAAAGIFEDTWQAESMAEVCDIIAAWCRAARRDLALAEGDAPLPSEFRAAEQIVAGQAVEVDPASGGVRVWRGGSGGLGRALAGADPGEPVALYPPPVSAEDTARRTLTAQLARHRATCQQCRDRNDRAGRNRRGCQDADRIIGQLQRLAADGR